MDHRISKDMISSGMSYTGQKTQADLGRTQYGSAARPDSLSEAYASMYSIKEQEEAMGQHPGKSPNKAVRDKYETETRRKQAPTNVGVPDKSKGYVPLKDDVDLFDLIKGHLMDEGLTEAAAIEMMVSMTEEERDAVIEGLNYPMTVNVADVKGGTEAAKRAAAGMKLKDGSPMYKPGKGVGPDFKLLKGV